MPDFSRIDNVLPEDYEVGLSEDDFESLEKSHEMEVELLEDIILRLSYSGLKWDDKLIARLKLITSAYEG